MGDCQAKALIRIGHSELVELLLLVFIFRIDEFARQTVHNCKLTQLCPEEIDFLRLIFFVEEPPEAILEKGTHHHLIVTFPDVTSVDLILNTIMSS